MQDLHNIFGEYNEFIKVDAMLYNLKFRMGIYKRDETFDEFYARFIITISPLGLSDAYKILNLKRIVSTRIRYKLVDGITYNTFSDFV